MCYNVEKLDGRKMAGEHDGHRKRMIQKLETGNLLEHELLEVMLFPLLPRKNTNDIAHRLLQKFGSMQGVLRAHKEELMQVKGIGENCASNLRCIGIVYDKYFTDKKESYEGKDERLNFLSFVDKEYRDLDYEVFDIYLLNKSNEIIHRKRYTENETVTAKIRVNELLKVCSKENPFGVVLVHNHPKGDSHPSNADDETTGLFQVVCSMHGVILCDHCIYSPKGVYSYYLSGNLQKISKSFSFEGLIKDKEKTHE